MKHLYIALFLVLSTILHHHCLAQYTVLGIMPATGRVTLKKTNQNIKRGDVISIQDEIKFIDIAAKVVTVDGQGKRFEISINDKTRTQVSSSGLGEFFQVSNGLIPGTGVGGSKGLLTDLKQLKQYIAASSEAKENYDPSTPVSKVFFKAKPFLFLGRVSADIPLTDFIQNESNNRFFYVSYTYNDEPIQIPLKYEGTKMLMDKASLFENVSLRNGTKANVDPLVVKRCELWYYNENKEPVSVLINAFMPVFTDEQNLKEELKLMISKKPASVGNKDFIGNEIMPYLAQYYGKPDSDNLREWLQKELDFVSEK